MNPRTLIQRLLGRPTCVTGIGTQLSWRSRVLNAGARSDHIKIGNHTHIDGELFVFAHGGRIQIGDWCFIGPESRIWSAAEIIIGDRVLISHGCNIMDSLTHPLNPKARHLQFKSILTVGHPKQIELDEKPVRVGNDAWIGAGATILRGVSIGNCAVVGAGAVVTHDVADCTVVAGNPARPIRQLTAAELEE